MPAEVVVVGAGGFGREALDVLDAMAAGSRRPELRVLGVADDAPSGVNLGRLADRGVPHLGGLDDLVRTVEPRRFVLGVGNPEVRRSLAGRLEQAGWEPLTLVHPNAVIGSMARIGAGGVVCAGVQLSTNVRLGRHVHLNPGSIIGHDARLGDWVSVNPGAVISGEVAVGSATLIGAGAVVLQGLSVGDRVVVGAAACVTRDVADGQTVVGVPARPMAGA